MAGEPQRSLGRLSEIGRVATRHGFGYVFDRRRAHRRQPLADRGRRLREMLDELGPTFVKFGQLLSTRPDVVPPDIVVELRKLQDDVTPIPFDEVARVVEEELGLTIEQAFLYFDERRSPPPRSARCTARRCRTARRRRQGAAAGAPRQIESDLQLMRSAARFVRERVRALDFIDTEELVDEFARSIRQELDYQQEARNAETFRRNFARRRPGRGAARVVAVHDGPRADARAPRGHAHPRPRPRVRGRPRSAASSRTG